jgi:hypothetical protein
VPGNTEAFIKQQAIPWITAFCIKDPRPTANPMMKYLHEAAVAVSKLPKAISRVPGTMRDRQKAAVISAAKANVNAGLDSEGDVEMD